MAVAITGSGWNGRGTARLPYFTRAAPPIDTANSRSTKERLELRGGGNGSDSDVVAAFCRSSGSAQVFELCPRCVCRLTPAARALLSGRCAHTRGKFLTGMRVTEAIAARRCRSGSECAETGGTCATSTPACTSQYAYKSRLM
jgi:hypothetical protein